MYETYRQLQEVLKTFDARIDSRRGLELTLAYICHEIDELKKGQETATTQIEDQTP